MEIIIIVAVSSYNNGIGKNNDLLWNLPGDMKFFRSQTNGYPIITGRKNYESIPDKFRPLNNRENIVVTRQNIEFNGAQVCSSIKEALEIASSYKKEKIFIIGGGQIYTMALDAGVIDTMYLTHVHGSPEGDAFFPEFDPQEWTMQVIDNHPEDERHEFSFTICRYDRKQP